MLNNDNEESRKMIEQCYKLNKTVVNPIIDWTNEDVWEFIKEYNIPYCKLYDDGYKRLGCIGCPMSTHHGEELEKYPKYKKAYLSAFRRMLEEGRKRGVDYENWENEFDVYEWWITGGKNKNNNGNVEMLL